MKLKEIRKEKKLSVPELSNLSGGTGAAEGDLRFRKAWRRQSLHAYQTL